MSGLIAITMYGGGGALTVAAIIGWLSWLMEIGTDWLDGPGGD